MNDPTPIPTLPFEVDGPPRAYFELSNDTSIHITRLVYRTIAVTGPTEDSVRAWMDDALAIIREWCADEDAIIFWRRRPQFSRDDDSTWKGTCRLITSLPMPEHLWSQIEVKPDEPPRRIP